MPEHIDLDFYIDPSCGWAWRTSLWARLVATERPITITWKPFSLSVVNSPEGWENDTSVGHMRGARLLRALMAARREGGNAALDRLLIAYGNAMHGRHEDLHEDAVQERCLEAAGLSKTLYADALRDPSTEQEMVTETRAAMEKLSVFGVPTLALAGSDIAVFGPVVNPVPTGQSALDLWDWTHFSLKQTGLYELKRTRVKYERPQFADAHGLPVDELVSAS